MPRILETNGISQEIAKPAILVSYAVLTTFQKHETQYKNKYRSWILDSGAYSVLTSGIEISLDNYICDTLRLQQSEKPPKTIFALDVIGDPEASARNTEKMVQAGVNAVPTFHYGSSWHYLLHMTKTYDKIALGGMVARGADGYSNRLDWKARRRFIDQCFARVWPKWVHGFGITDPRLLFSVPFASVDSTTWNYRVNRFGEIPGYSKIPALGTDCKVLPSAMRMSLERYEKLEYEVRGRMGRALAKVTSSPFDLCLGVAGPELRHM